MRGLNDVKLYGRIVKDAELRKTERGRSAAVFSVAANRSLRDGGGGWTEAADFIPMAAYGGAASEGVGQEESAEELERIYGMYDGDGEDEEFSEEYDF